MHRPIRLQLFGGFDLQVDGERVVQLPKKARAMLAYLALDGGHAPSREVIGDLLWPAVAPQQMRDSLRQSLFVLRRRLDPTGDRVKSYDGVPVLTPDVVDCDAWLVRDIGEAAPVGQLRAADSAYAGPLLKNFPPVSSEFDQWLAVARANLEERALRLLGRLADHAEDDGDTSEAVRLAEQMMEIDPLREDTHRRLLAALDRAGRRSDAVRHYASIKGLLQRELQVEPAPETKALATRIRDSLETTVPAQPASGRRGGAPVIAVLPFQQLGPMQVPRHLANGLVADIIAQLTGLHELGVISHGSTINFQDDGTEPREVGRQLGASYVVRGTMRCDGKDTRLTKELVEAESSAVIWSHIDDIRGTPSFTEQDRIVGQLVNTLTPRVQEAELRRIRGKRPVSLTVYEKTLLARERLEALGRDNILEARAVLDEVIAEEPSYAEAHALAADCHGLIVAEGWTEARSEDIARVEEHSRTALSLDRDNVRALVFYGHRRSLLHRDYETAKSLFQRALENAPSSALAMRWSSLTYSYVEECGEAISRAYRALELSPCDRDAHSFYLALCIAYYTARDYEKAVEWGARAMSEPPLLRGTSAWLAAALAGVGRMAEAREVAAECMRLWPERRIGTVVAHHPYRDPERRRQHGELLLAAGFPE